LAVVERPHPYSTAHRRGRRATHAAADRRPRRRQKTVDRGRAHAEQPRADLSLGVEVPVPL
jgi:hypothetical protein